MTVNNYDKKTIYNIRFKILVCLFLAITILIVYLQVRNYEFVNFDDDKYVTENYYVGKGLSIDGIKWSFGFADKDKTYWHPLTWLSHMMDVQLYGMDSGCHHLTNLFYHIASSVLLFLVFFKMTGALWRSAFIAALFALHPINVESVVWVAERKNVLSTFLWMLTMLAYVHFTKQPELLRYLSVVFLFILGLLTKPFLVTLPCVLLLLDYWPLGRIRFELVAANQDEKKKKSIIFRFRASPFLYLFIEKIPLFMLSAFSILISSLSVQGPGGAISKEIVPVNLRIANALVSYIKYIGKMLWPENLAVLYPYPDMLPLWQSICSLLLLICVSYFLIRMIKTTPSLMVGWLWYIGTLVPVIGIIQVGLWPAMADRWAYVPFIGLFIIIAWGIPELLKKLRYNKVIVTIGIIALLPILMFATHFQTQYWSNSFSLFEHTLSVTANNYVAYNQAGRALEVRGENEEAARYYYKALQIKPNYGHALNNIGNILIRKGRSKEAIKNYSEAIRINPGNANAYNNLGVALIQSGRFDEAIPLLRTALRIKPKYAEAYSNLGVAMVEKGRVDKAIICFQEALRIKPDYRNAHNNLNKTLKLIDTKLEN